MALRSVLVSVLVCSSTVLVGAQAPAQVPTGDSHRVEPRVEPRVERRSLDDPITSVLAISIDGLNPDALEQLGAAGTPTSTT